MSLMDSILKNLITKDGVKRQSEVDTLSMTEIKKILDTLPGEEKDQVEQLVVDVMEGYRKHQAQYVSELHKTMASVTGFDDAELVTQTRNKPYGAQFSYSMALELVCKLAMHYAKGVQ